MNSANHCPDCGAPLPADAPQGNCPQCLWRLALKQSAPDEAATILAIPTSEMPGDRIGRYKLLEKLGEGGFGVVYMAEQREPVRRKVALKIIKVGMDTRDVVARFEAERQALALMDHPNIAKVLDGGATGSAESQISDLKSQIPSGRPYFVMELVRGIRITDFCDQNHLDVEERLKLFMQVCQAVQHAHQKGIIHRDLKPSNILVTINDGVPVPKVIDFGIAKATQQELTEKTLFTAYGQFLGTPAYMSPEQTVMTSLDIDTRSDIYSLGVLLYELLTGKPPFDTQALMKAGLDELCRTLREVEPPRPSTRLSTMVGDALAGIAKFRKTDPPKLVSYVRGDLDWIAMKCLEKDRARRYETANGLVADIQRHLRNEPIIARPPSALYTFQKLARRHKVAFTASAAVVAAVLMGLVTSTGLFMKERATRRRAQSAEEAATANAQRVSHLAEENRQRLLRLQIDTGARHLREGNLMGALPWFVEAFKLDHGQPANESVHQFRLASLFQQCPRPLQMLFHTGSVSRAVFSPDGTRVLSVTRSETAVLWDANTGQQLASMDAGKRLTGAVFSPDGSQAVVEGTNGYFLWNFSSSPPAVQPLDSHGSALATSWNSAGTQFVTTDGKETATLWNVRDGGNLPLQHDSPAIILTAAFVPRELALQNAQANSTSTTTNLPPVILTVDSAGLLRFWDTAKGVLLSERTLEPKSSPWQLGRLSADGSRLIMVHNPDDPRSPSHARIFSVRGARPIAEAISHDSFIHPPVFGPNIVVTGSRDGTARIWDTRSGSLKVSPLRHGSEVTALALSQDAHLLLTGCADGTARLWSVSLGRAVGPPLLHGGAVGDVDFGPANHSALTASIDGTVRLWNLAAAPRLRWLPQTAPGRAGTYGRTWGAIHEMRDGVETSGVVPGEPRSVAVAWRGKFAPAAGGSMTKDGSRLLLPQEVGGKVEYQLLATASGQALGPIFSVPGNMETLFGCSLNADGTLFAVRSGTTLQVWNVLTGKLAAPEITPESRPSFPDLSPDGRTLMWRSEGKVFVWDVAAGRESFPPLAQPGEIFSMCFSSDNRWLLTVSDSTGAEPSCAQIWDVLSGQRVAPPMPHADSVNFAAFSEDARWVVTASKDRTARVWDAATGQPRTPALEHPDEVQMASFSHDQRRVFTACEDGSVRIWDAATGEPLAAPIPHFFPVRYVFPLLGGRFLHSTSQHTHRWELPDASRPVEDWEALAQLLSGRRLEASGRLRPLDRVELSKVWNALRMRLPEEFSTSLAQREDWNNWMTQMYFANGHNNKAGPYLNELVALQPHLFIHRWNRAYANKYPGRWNVAVEDLKAAARIDPKENAVWADLAQAELVLGNLEGYRAACAEMAERLTFADRKVYLGEWCSIACNASNPPAMLQRLLSLLEEIGPPPPPTLYSRGRDWQYYAALGALSFRLGRDADAIQNLEKARTIREGGRRMLLFLAMAHHRLGHASEAHSLLDNVQARIVEDEKMFDLGRSFDSYGDLAVSKLLLHEADELMHQ